jgi:predicted kinase
MAGRVYILCGLPFAGKSTLARELAARLGWTHLEVDAIHRERGQGLHGEQLSRQSWIDAYREAYRRLDELLRDQRTVLYDATNFRRAQRQRARQIAARHGATACVLYVTTPAMAAQQRLHQNRQLPARADVHDIDFAAVAAQFQPPTADEDMLQYNGAAPVAVWIADTFGQAAAQ